jgi:hypothetical protein
MIRTRPDEQPIATERPEIARECGPAAQYLTGNHRRFFGSLVIQAPSFPRPGSICFLAEAKQRLGTGVFESDADTHSCRPNVPVLVRKQLELTL